MHRSSSISGMSPQPPTIPAPVPDKTRSLKTLALTGSLWTLGGYGLSQVLRLGNHLILARLLTPEIFGLMALVKLVEQGLGMFSDVGIRPSIIQNRRGDEPAFLNTAWTIQIIRGFTLWICATILAWPFAAWFARNDPAAWQLRYLLPVAGLASVLSGFNSTALATLSRRLRLGRLTFLEFASQLVSLSVMIVWALITPTVWAMVGGLLAGAAFKMAASHCLMSGSPVRIAWDRHCASELLRFGKWIFLSTAFHFLAVNIDKLILGNLLSLGDLGLYSIALVFAKVAMYVTARLGGTVMFPVYSRFQDEPHRMISLAIRARWIILCLGVAVCLSFAIGAPLFFEVLWDPRYHAAAPIAQWIVLFIWATILLLTMDRIPLALGNSRALFFASVWQCSGGAFAACGYILAGLPGFVGGLALGPIVAQLYLLRHMPFHRISILKQGVQFTLVAMLYGIPALLATAWLRRSAPWWLWVVFVLLLSGIPPILAALLAWKRTRREFARR